MGFNNLDTETGISVLNQFLEDKSYIEGYQPSQSDLSVYNAVKQSLIQKEKYPHAYRWYKHIANYSNQNLPGQKKDVSQLGPETTTTNNEDEDDDIDLFGSDDEVDEAAEKLKQQRLAEYAAKKSQKPKVIAKSMITFDVKPWDDTTDMQLMESSVRSIEMDGLLWGKSQLIPVGYGIKKLRIACVVEDDKVSTDILEEKITEFEDYVQSVDIEAFSKI